MRNDFKNFLILFIIFSIVFPPHYKNKIAGQISFELYEVTSKDSAQSLFAKKSGGSKPNLKIGDAAVSFDYYLLFIKNNYYISIAAEKATAQTAKVLIEAAKDVVTKLP